MKIDEIIALAEGIRLEHILTDRSGYTIEPKDVVLDIQGKGDLINTFPVPECARCETKCCPPRLELSLFDIARFMDAKLDAFISGTFKKYMEFSVWTPDSGTPLKRPVPYISCSTSDLYCIFLDKNERCSIYETRAPACSSFPLTLRQDQRGNLVLQWIARCQNYKISSDKDVFLQLVDNSIRTCNEWMANHMLIVHARKQLREMGFAKYLGDESHYLRNRAQRADTQLIRK